ncbi:MAG: hypothetical protein Q8M19_21080 [Reyranella sp.]|nr:hypothetical protein [Reyranella sp.]
MALRVDYGKRCFPRDQFEALADRQCRLEGRFLVSLNDVPEVRRLFRGCRIEVVRTTYTLAKNQAVAAVPRSC